MPEPSTLEHVANIIIRRTIAEVQDPQQLAEALARACPFTEDPRFYEIWLRALERHGIPTKDFATPKPKTKREDNGEDKSLEADSSGNP
jgi:hypothetical protein